MLVTIGYLIYKAPEAIKSLAQSLEIPESIARIQAKWSEKNEEIKLACTEVILLLR